MRRFLTAAALAAALLVPAALAPTSVAADSCFSNVVGQTTFTRCSGPGAASSSGTSIRVGDTSFESVHGQDQYGQDYSGSGTTIRVGDSSFSQWNAYP